MQLRNWDYNTVHLGLVLDSRIYCDLKQNCRDHLGTLCNNIYMCMYLPLTTTEKVIAKANPIARLLFAWWLVASVVDCCAVNNHTYMYMFNIIGSGAH